MRAGTELLGGRRPASEGGGHERRADRRAARRGRRRPIAGSGLADPEPCRRLALLLAYEGTAYRGWQVQAEAPTVQGLVTAALVDLAPGPVRVVGASRTDAGVHALGQVASAAVSRPVAPAVAGAALNARLPRDVRVLAARGVSEGFDARRSARLKRYAYLLDTGRVPFLFGRSFAWHTGGPLDAAAMRQALGPLRGRHDFSAFCASAGRGRDSACRVHALRVVTRGPLVAILVSADRFLHHMVRNIVGSALEVGRGRRSPGWLAEVLAGRDRRQAGVTAPARGLFLVRVCYPEPVFPGGRHLGARPAAAGRARWPDSPGSA